MTIKEYFKDWLKVIDRTELIRVTQWISKQNPNELCPSPQDIFRAFTLCSFKDCKVVLIGQDPYPQKGVATGILFGNKANIPEDKLSPSLEVIKEAAINYEIPHQGIQFDNTLESWAKQGILMINSALTCKVNDIGSHTLVWRPFISKLLHNMSTAESGIIYVLFGKQAQSFKSHIIGNNNIIEIEHPSYFARTNTSMPSSLFTDINKLLKDKYGTTITWYQELYNINNKEYEEEKSYCDDFYWPSSL